MSFKDKIMTLVKAQVDEGMGQQLSHLEQMQQGMDLLQEMR